MSHCEQEERALLYALGLLEGAEANLFESHIKECAICQADVRESGDLAVRLAETLPPAVPPAGLRQRVLTEAKLPRGVMALVRGSQMEWQPSGFDGVFVARLFEDPVRGELASLVKILPGGRYPTHRHASLEHCYVLEGDLVFEDHTLTAGDYSVGSPRQDHTSATSKMGCMLFIVHNLGDQVHIN